MEFLDAADTILRFDENGTIEVEDGQGDQVLRHVDLPAVSISSASTVPEELNETPAKVAAVNSTEPVQGQPLDNAYHRGDWTLWLFFMKAAPKWTFVLFIFISCAEALAERMTCKSPINSLLRELRNVLTLAHQLSLCASGLTRVPIPRCHLPCMLFWASRRP